MSEPTIIKLQRPLNDAKGPVFAYTEGKVLTAFLPQTPELMALFGDKPKVYVEGFLAHGVVIINLVVDDQTW